MYKVKLNGQEIKVTETRVSALPLNKLWDGVQRPAEQSEIAYWSTMDISKPAVLEIEIEKDFEKVELRPLSKNIRFTREGRKITLTVEKPMQFTVEADGYHNALHIFVNPESSKPEGENVYYFDKGEHDVGLLWLESDTTLYLEEGAVLKGVIYGYKVNNVKILGRGVVNSANCRRGNDDNLGDRVPIEALKEKGFEYDDRKYIGNIVLNECKDITVEGIVLEDSPLWSVIIRNGCENITVDNIKIIGQWRYNSDGIDVCVSKNVVVRNCFIRSFDDCLIARGAYLPGEEGNVENLLVENCVCWCDWGIAMKAWAGQKVTAVHNVTFRDNYVIRVNNMVMSIVTYYGSKNSVIENILFDGVYIDSDPEYMTPRCEDATHKGYKPGNGFTPHMILILTGKIGKMGEQGSQLFTPVDDYTDFNVYYRNIAFNNVKYSGKPLKAEIEENPGVLEISNISVTNSDFSF